MGSNYSSEKCALGEELTEMHPLQKVLLFGWVKKNRWEISGLRKRFILFRQQGERKSFQSLLPPNDGKSRPSMGF